MSGSPVPKTPHVEGRLVIRFKPGALAAPARAAVGAGMGLAGMRAAAESVPDSVRGPLDHLERNFGLKALRPLFAAAKPVPRRAPAGFGLAARAGALVEAVAEPPRASLQGFTVAEIDGTVTDALIRRIDQSPAVALVERVPNRWPAAADPSANLQWGLRSIGWFVAPRPDAATVEVAVLDTGVDRDHGDLAAAIDFYEPFRNGRDDPHGHGTHVAGVIAAVVDNGVGIAGIANCRLHVWKIFDDPPTRADNVAFNFENYNAALAAILERRIPVVNLSIAGTASSETERLMMRTLSEEGVLVCAAMGNEFEEGNPTSFPAAYPTVLAVGAVGETLRRAAFSNTGRHIGLVAPGESILSTLPMKRSHLREEAEFAAWSGTSMATPHVAGVAAQLAARDPALRGRAIADRLVGTARQ
ncbi:MAG: S8 family serine peptidase, partial [Alphaproteobacteria bacterium]